MCPRAQPATVTGEQQHDSMVSVVSHCDDCSGRVACETLRRGELTGPAAFGAGAIGSEEATVAGGVQACTMVVIVSDGALRSASNDSDAPWAIELSAAAA